MRLRIVSDGTAYNTRVFLADTGEEIGELVTAVTWGLDCNKDRMARVTLELLGPHVEIDVVGEGEATSVTRAPEPIRIPSFEETHRGKK